MTTPILLRSLFRAPSPSPSPSPFRPVLNSASSLLQAHHSFHSSSSLPLPLPSRYRYRYRYTVTSTSTSTSTSTGGPLLNNLNACEKRQSTSPLNRASSPWKRSVTTGGGASPHRQKKDGFPILPIVAIAIGGSGFFYFMVKNREGNIPEKLRSKERG